MKKLFAFALIAALMTSCAKETLDSVSGSGCAGNGKYSYTIKGTFGSEDDTAADDVKVAIGTEDGKYFGIWEEGDQVVIYETTTTTATSRNRITDDPITVSNISQDGKTADISFTTDYDQTQVCRAFYYSDCIKDLKYGQGILPCNQVQAGTGLANTSLKKYAFIYTASASSIANKIKNPSESCKFYHAFSYVEILFKSADFAGWKVDKLVLRNDSGTRLASSVEVNCSIVPWLSGSNASAIAKTSGTQVDHIVLSFENDVILSDTAQDAWMVAVPTYLSAAKDAESNPSQDPQVHTVFFQLSRDGVVKYAKVRFNTCLKGGTIKPLNVGYITTADIIGNIDYKEIYDAGLDILIGDLTVNSTTFPTSSVKTPKDISLGSSAPFGSGLVFIDDDQGADINLTHSYPSLSSSSAETVLIGRYANIGKQTNLKGQSFRIWKDLSVLNLKFTSTGGQTLFERTTTVTSMNAFRLYDCYVDLTTTTPTSAVIREGSKNGDNIAAPFSKILIDNCVFKMGTNDKPFYLLNYLGTTSGTPRTLSVNNSVIFYESARHIPGLITYNNNSVDEDFTINFKSNTVVNIVSGSLIKVYKVADVVSDRDIVYVSGITTKPSDYNTPKYHWGVSCTSSTVGSCKNCYFAMDNMWSTIAKWSMYAATYSNNTNVKDEGMPFTTADYSLGYFPVDGTKVTNGAGASYDNKGYVNWTEQE